MTSNAACATVGPATSNTLAITVNPLPANAGTISGTTNVFKGQYGVVYTVPAILNSTSYVWTLPGGVSGLSTTNSILVDFGNDAVSGTIKVKGHNNCGDGTESALAITVILNKAPISNAGIDQSVNSGILITLDGFYSSDPDNDALTYSWTPPAGITLSSNTASKPTFTAPEVAFNTNYTFSLTVNDGIVNSAVDQVVIEVKSPKTEPSITDQKMIVYPNPTTGKVKILFDQIYESGSYLTLEDINGKTILKKFIYNKEEMIDISGYPSGIYLIKTNIKNIKGQKIILN